MHWVKAQVNACISICIFIAISSDLIIPYIGSKLYLKNYYRFYNDVLSIYLKYCLLLRNEIFRQNCTFEKEISLIDMSDF